MSADPPDHFRVLVVDGDIFVRLSIADELEERGFEVLEAASGADALFFLNSGLRIDAVFADVNLPGNIDGFALAQLVCSRFSPVSVILTSGHPRAKGQAERARIPFVAKLYQTDQVVAALKLVLPNQMPRDPRNNSNLIDCRRD